MGLDRGRTEQQQGCRVRQGNRWRRGELLFIKTFHELQRAGGHTMCVCGGGVERQKSWLE